MTYLVDDFCQVVLSKELIEIHIRAVCREQQQPS